MRHGAHYPAVVVRLADVRAVVLARQTLEFQGQDGIGLIYRRDHSEILQMLAAL